MKSILKGLFLYEVEASVGPAADIYETDTDLVYEIDLPGVDVAGVSVKVYEDLLIIESERVINDEQGSVELKYQCMERHTKGFRRIMKIPVYVNVMAGDAFYANGVLTIRFPKLNNRLLKINVEKR